MTDHANCQPEAWAAAARVTRELREERDGLRKEVDRLRAENDRLRKQVQDYHESAYAHVAKFDRQHERLMEAESEVERLNLEVVQVQSGAQIAMNAGVAALQEVKRLEGVVAGLKEINDRMAEDRLRIIDERDGFRKMMNSTVSAGVTIDGERLDALREVERLQGIVEAVKALHRPDDEAFLARQGWAYCLTCVDESHPCDTRRAVDQASAFQ